MREEAANEQGNSCSIMKKKLELQRFYNMN